MICGTAPSGLRYAVERGGRAAAVCALTIGCGTRDEGAFPKGIAHFTEHAIFRGTRHHGASYISSCLDRLGGELNAFTTKEEIVIHSTVLKEDLPKAARLLFELATEPSFPADEIETERGVILDEIISCKDTPADDIYDNFECLLFKGTNLGTPILGTTASVKKITPEMLRSFVSEHFLPKKMAFTVVADIDETKLEKLVLRLSGNVWPEKLPVSGPVRANSFSDQTFSKSISFDKTSDKRNHEVNAVIGGFAPSLHEMPERLVAAFLANILGGPASNSLLNAELREKRGWVYGIECSYTQYADTGIVAISFGCDKENLENCKKSIYKILGKLRKVPLSETHLRACRKQLLGQIALSGESAETRCLSMGKSLLSWGSVMSPEETRHHLEAITPADLQTMAQKLFAPDALSSLVYL